MKNQKKSWSFTVPRFYYYLSYGTIDALSYKISPQMLDTYKYHLRVLNQYTSNPPFTVHFFMLKHILLSLHIKYSILFLNLPLLDCDHIYLRPILHFISILSLSDHIYLLRPWIARFLYNQNFSFSFANYSFEYDWKLLQILSYSHSTTRIKTSTLRL